MDVAIIGGGIAGLVLGLTLHQQSIKCTVYELRETSDIANPGAVGLAPNALRTLDNLGLLQDICDKGWPLETMQFRNISDELISTLEMGSKGSQYTTLRIVRRRLHSVLLTAAQKANINIVTGKRFSHVVTTTPSGVTFAFTDQTQATCSVLIGADGIHSTLRNHLVPEVKPEYTGSLTLMAVLNSNPLLNPSRPPSPSMLSRLHNINIITGPIGSFIFIVGSSSGQEVTLGIVRPHQSQTREEWDTLLSSLEKQHGLFMEDLESWPDIVQTLMRDVKVEDMYRSWPFYELPELKSWVSDDWRIVLIGDAAHAVPPSAGQGACMAIEDAWSLGLTLGRCQEVGIKVWSQEYEKLVMRWMDERMRRIGKVRRLTTQLGNRRLPVPRELGNGAGGRKTTGAVEADKDIHEQGLDTTDMSWLYGYEYKVDSVV